MRKPTSPGFIVLCLASLFFATNGKSVSDEKSSAEKEQPPVVNLVEQGFPVGKADPKDLTKSDTAWVIEWTITSPDNGYVDPKTKKRRRSKSPSSVLAIRSAKFMYKDQYGKTRWITVLKNLELGEMMVPYDTTRPTFYDVARHAFNIIPAKEEYLGPNCVAPGKILKSEDPRMSGKVMLEFHDDGLRWLNGSNKARRGEKMTIWSVFNGANYRYLIEYNFVDDGSIVCRVGATAHNYFSRQKDGRDVHLHVGCWRFDPHLSDPDSPKLGGPDHNAVYMVRRMPEPKKPGHFFIDTKPFNPNASGVSREGFGDWVAKEFTILRIQSTVRKNGNAFKMPTAYDLIPLRYGSVRNYPKSAEFVNHDFWVTQTDPKYKTYSRVPTYAKDKRTLEGKPLTIWHNSASLHNPRAEDWSPNGASRGGSALVVWAGFILRPRNLFDCTPLYPVTSTVPRGKPILQVDGKLTKNDEKDTVRKASYCNVHTIKMKRGIHYTIDMTGRFDTFLRLEDASGKQVAYNDDSGPGLNARIEFRPTADGEFRIIATSFRPRAMGSYKLTVHAAEQP